MESQCLYVIVKSRCQHDIAVVSQVQSAVEDVRNNHGIVQAYTGFNWLLFHALMTSKVVKQFCLVTNQERALIFLRLKGNFSETTKDGRVELEVNFPRCPGDSPACLDILGYDRCGTHGLMERLDKEIEK